MKKLEELGISKAPWRVWDIAVNTDTTRGNASTVVDSDGRPLAKDGLFRAEDAEFIARAPDMYETLARLREDLSDFADRLTDSPIKAWFENTICRIDAALSGNSPAGNP